MMRPKLRLLVCACFGLCLYCLGFLACTNTSVRAQSLTVSALVMGPPPSTSAIIKQPGDGTHLGTVPLVVIGSCQPNLIVRIFDNDQLAGSAACSIAGQFTVNITLQEGVNTLQARNYDMFDRAGPESASKKVFVDIAQVNQDMVRKQKENLHSTGNEVNFFAGTPLAPIKFPGIPGLVVENQMVVRILVNISFSVIALALMFLLFL